MAGPDEVSVMADIASLRRAIEAPAVPPHSSWKPITCRLIPGQLTDIQACCTERGIAVIDPIARQLEELAAIHFPDPAAHEDRTRLVREHVRDAGGAESYGCWVYFPWDRTIVHLLDPDDFYAVITSRNENKITRAEQDILRTKRIGVMGLSVGGEAAVTLAQEHLCGEIYLADFDALDLSNLNRLNAAVDQLGCNKAIIAARRIAKIDPYMSVRLFPAGVTPDNTDDFLNGLDVLIEECDDLPLKSLIRQLARERGIDIVFAADERGFLSIEPYRTSPALRPFHGRVEKPQPPRASYASATEFWRALTAWMGGWESISERSRESLGQIGKTLCGYPQLASEARFAAGQIGHVVRRMLLGERFAPFLGHLDLDQLINPRSTSRPRCE
jgi:hypothetical protein